MKANQNGARTFQPNTSCLLLPADCLLPTASCQLPSPLLPIPFPSPFEIRNPQFEFRISAQDPARSNKATAATPPASAETHNRIRPIHPTLRHEQSDNRTTPPAEQSLSTFERDRQSLSFPHPPKRSSSLPAPCIAAVTETSDSTVCDRHEAFAI